MSIRHVLSRVLVALGTLFFVVVFNFFLFRAVGDPKKDLIRSRLDAAARQEIIRERGYDKSQLEQFRIYVGQLARGDLGDSFKREKPVSTLLADAIPNTLIVVGSATVIASLLGAWLGVAAGWRRGRPRDALITQGSIALYSMPEFWLGMVLIYVFAVRTDLLPTQFKGEPGAVYSGFLDQLADVSKHAILPVSTLALGLLAQYAVIMRASMVDAMREDFVLTARAIGLPPLLVRRRHVVPNALLPLVTVIGLNLGLVLGGVIAIETLFSWPGVGFLAYDAVGSKDFPVLQGVFLVTSAFVIVFNLLVDLIYARLDPRVRT